MDLLLLGVGLLILAALTILILRKPVATGGQDVETLRAQYHKESQERSAAIARLEQVEKLAEDYRGQLQQITAQRNSTEIALTESRQKLLTAERDNQKAQIDCATAQQECKEASQRVDDLLRQIAISKVTIDGHEGNLRQERERIEKLTAGLEKLHADHQEKCKEAASLESSHKALTEKLDTQQKEIVAIQERMKTEFRLVATQLLEEKSIKFKEDSKEQITTLLQPLAQNLQDFKKQVEETYEKEARERTSLEKQIIALNQTSIKLDEEARNLTKALKGDAKVMGDWGEQILVSILENSGLDASMYKTQTTYATEEEGDIRTDVEVFLPGDKKVVIDSKVSLVSYDAYCRAEGEEERNSAANALVASVRNHIKGLASHHYHVAADAADFTMMFVPLEGAYMLAMHQDRSIWKEALDKKVILISATNLVAALKIISDLWVRDKANRQTEQIQILGAKMYDKIVSIAENLEAVGRSLDKTRDDYDKAMGQIKTGKGNLIAKAEEMHALGLKTKKRLQTSKAAKALNLDYAPDEDDQDLEREEPTLVIEAGEEIA